MLPRKTDPADQVRRDLYNHVKKWFDESMLEFSQEDLWFLNQMLMTYDSAWTGHPLGLVNAFEENIARRGQYVLTCGDEERKAVEDFLAEYRASEGRLAPRGDGWYLWRKPAAQSVD